ncbi:MAG: hypothetical protein NVS4B11_24720 [Ktedonobacteraceae bacterium]
MHVFSRLHWRARIIATLSLALMLIVAFIFVLTSHVATHAAGGDKTYRFGPIHSTSPDSGTCGNNWANDTFDRVFIVHSSNPNTFVELFQNGAIVTLAGQSPAACQILPPPMGNGNTVGAGVTGNFHGEFGVVTVTGGTFNPKAKCTQTTCSNTTAFCTTVYGPTAMCSVDSFEFNYYTHENGSWHNASADEGPNSGDITGTANPNVSVHHNSVKHSSGSNYHHVSKPSVN